MMRTVSSSPFRQDGRIQNGLLRLGSLITSRPGLLVLNIALLGAALAVFLGLQGAEASQASAIVLPTLFPEASPAAESQPVRPSPTSTRPAASTPTATSQLAASASAPDAPVPEAALPSQAAVGEIQGHKQSMPLSCEARSAVDWAAFFGVEIDEGKFFSGLPVDDNPDVGFVGDVYGSWGQIPPDDYGVHAGPIAQRLREFGLQAKDLRHMTLEELKWEIAAGRPVIVWVVGHVNRGTPVPYSASSGAVTTVAKFEHTVIVIGFKGPKITVLDGARVYSIYEGEFSKSWGVLENQAVVWID